MNRGLEVIRKPSFKQRKRLSKKPRPSRSRTNMRVAARAVKTLVVSMEPNLIPRLWKRPVSWERLPPKTKIYASLGAMFSQPNYRPFAFTINVHRKLSQRLYKNESRKYVRDFVRKTIGKAIPDQELFYLLIQESNGRNRVHFHGVILIPEGEEVFIIASRVSSALRSCRLSRKYRERWKNKAVLLTDAYGAFTESNPEGKPIDFGWADYITKDMSRGTNIIMTNSLRRESKAFVNLLRGKSLDTNQEKHNEI